MSYAQHRVASMRLAAMATLGFLTILMGSPASAMPIVFDFEDGTAQGWTLGENTFLHATQGIFSPDLEPRMAIFGFDGSSMWIQLDLTNIAAMTWEEYDPAVRQGEVPSTARFAFVQIFPGVSPPFDSLVGAVSDLANPTTRTFDLFDLAGVHTVMIRWSRVFFIPGTEPPAPTVFNAGFINTVTFHPIPEPTPLYSLLISVFLVSAFARRSLHRRNE